jgi:hypothetical protein
MNHTSHPTCLDTPGFADKLLTIIYNILLFRLNCIRVQMSGGREKERTTMRIDEARNQKYKYNEVTIISP